MSNIIFAKNSNMTSFFRFVSKRAINLDGKISFHMHGVHI